MILMLMEVLKLCFDFCGIFVDKIFIVIVGILLFVVEMVVNDMNLDVFVKVMFFNLNVKMLIFFIL